MSGSNNAARRATIAAAGESIFKKKMLPAIADHGEVLRNCEWLIRAAQKDRRSRIVSREMVVFRMAWRGEHSVVQGGQ